MDARTFEPDEPLPRVCKHCAWGKREQVQYVGLTITCKSKQALKERSKDMPGLPSLVPTGVYVGASETCDHWEERK
jgi:hypothetical protein